MGKEQIILLFICKNIFQFNHDDLKIVLNCYQNSLQLAYDNKFLKLQQINIDLYQKLNLPTLACGFINLQALKL